MTILASMGLRGQRHPGDSAYREFFEQIEEGFFVGELIRDDAGLVQDFRFLELNEAFARQSGLSPRALLGMRARDAIPDFPQDLIRCFGHAGDLGGTLKREMRIQPFGNRWFTMCAHPVDEQRFMVLSFDITERKQVEETLKESEALLSDIVETVDQLVWSARPDGYHDFFNRRWYEFTGTEPGFSNGEQWLMLFHPDDREHTEELWRRSLASGTPYEVEYRLRHHASGWRWMLGRAHPVRNEAGSIIRWMGTCTDIHEQKELAEQLELASHELAHRIKNIFAVISALVTLSVREFPEAKPFAEELRQRIDSLGKAHDYARPHGQASAPSASPATVLGLVRQLLSPYMIEGRERVVADGDDGPLNPDASTPLSLALHELATNSTKYGAFSATGGQVRIEGHRDGETYRLRWSERGGPAVQEPERFGFGSRLVEVSVRGRLGGELAREWLPEGLVVSLTAPASAIIKEV